MPVAVDVPVAVPDDYLRGGQVGVGVLSHGVPDGLGRRFIPLACMVEVLAAPVGGGVGDFHIARAPPPAGHSRGWLCPLRL